MTKFTQAQIEHLETKIEFLDAEDAAKGFSVLGSVWGNVWANVWGNVMGSVGGDVFGNVGGSVLGDVGGSVLGDVRGDVLVVGIQTGEKDDQN